MNPLIALEIVKQLFTFGGSFRKEAVGIGTFVPSLIIVLDACRLSGCSAVTPEQWTLLIGSTVALVTVLNAKRKEG